MSFKDFIERTANVQVNTVLNEESLSRFYALLNNPKNVFAIITASKDYRTPAEDKKLNRELRAYIRSTGWGFRKLLGHYPEEIKDEKGQSTGVVDHADDSSLIVVRPENRDMLYDFCFEMMKKYDQDAVLFKEADGTVKFIKKNGKETKLGDFHANKIDSYMSTFKNSRSFVFDVIDEKLEFGKIGNQFDHMIRNHELKNISKNGYNVDISDYLRD